MNLYKLSQNENNDYDTFDSVIVCAESENEARLIHPSSEFKSSYNHWKDGSWCKKPEQVTVKYIGIAAEGIEKGVVLASFNAG